MMIQTDNTLMNGAARRPVVKSKPKHTIISVCSPLIPHKNLLVGKQLVATRVEEEGRKYRIFVKRYHISSAIRHYRPVGREGNRVDGGRIASFSEKDPVWTMTK